MNSLVLMARPKALVRVASRAASASAAQNPVQRLFVDKVREFKSSNLGLDQAHQKAMEEEMKRLKRVYRIEDESKLAHLDYKFPAECNVSLRDLDEDKELRESVASGEYQKQIAKATQPRSELLESIPEQVTEDMHLPPMNKPSVGLVLEKACPAPKPVEMGEPKFDFVSNLEPMTPAKLEREMRVRFGDEMPTIYDDQAPERDLVNFPRVKQEEDTPPTRHHIIPESWFQFLYPKTGATGLYTLAATFGTFLFSKEWLIYEHEMIGGISCLAICTGAVLKFGPRIRNYLVDEIKLEIDGWDNWQSGNINFLTQLKNHYSSQLEKPQLIEDLYQIRQHDINMQAENEYRNRLKAIHDDAKRRLNYLISVADSKRQIAHKNMVNWVISGAVSSFGPKQESEVLDNCISNLKILSGKHAKAI